MARRTPTEWNALFEAHGQSNLSISEFAKQHGITPKYFSLKRQKWLSAKQDPNPFIMVNQQDTRPSHPSLKERIHLTGNYGELVLPSNVSPQWLGQLLREVSA